MVMPDRFRFTHYDYFTATALAKPAGRSPPTAPRLPTAASAIRTVFDQDGELSAALEVRRQFPGITDNGRAREWARTIASWKPLPEMQPRPWTRRAG